MTKEQMIEKIQETESFLYTLCKSDELDYVRKNYPFGFGKTNIVFRSLKTGDSNLWATRYQLLAIRKLMRDLGIQRIENEEARNYKEQARKWLEGIK